MAISHFFLSKIHYSIHPTKKRRKTKKKDLFLLGFTTPPKLANKGPAIYIIFSVLHFHTHHLKINNNPWMMLTSII